MAEVVGHEEGDGGDLEKATVVVDFMADWISKMEVISPEVLRAVSIGPAIRSLQRWRHGKDLNAYNKSFATAQIDEFWSHSWQRRPWKKVSTLLFLKRGLPAGIMGTLGALLGCTLTGFNLLSPSFPFGEISLWGTIFGSILFFLTLLLWPRTEGVFLDACCIHQTNLRKKADGIRSMSGILKQSKRMLVLWDKTYVDRLWCMFELAAFLKSRGEGSKASLQIRPTVLGPGVLAIVLSVSTFFIVIVAMFSYGWNRLDMMIVTCMAVLVLTYPAAAVFRDYFHSVQTLHDQLQNFRLANTKCYCCSVGHVTESGQPLPLCDRQILTKCIEIWFGSHQSFEDDARSLVLESFADQLGRHYFPYWLWLVATSPIFWVLLDITVDHIRLDHKERDRWPYWFISALGWWMGAVPSCAAAFFYSCKLFSAPRANKWNDRLMNLLVILVMLPIFACTFLMIEALFQWMMPLSPWLSATISSSSHIALAIIVWNGPAWIAKLRHGRAK